LQRSWALVERGDHLSLRPAVIAHDHHPFQLVALRFLPLGHGHDTVG
jgi:hypothetical protein